MGVRIEYNCCCCDLPCRGAACSLRNVPVPFCDECDSEAEEFYERGGDMLCEDCFVEAELEAAEKVESNGSCAWCGEESEMLYLMDGECVCKECFVEALLESATPVSAERLVENYY